MDGLLLLVSLFLAQALRDLAVWYSGWYAMRVPEYPLFLIPYRLGAVAGHPNLLAAFINLALPFAVLRLGRARKTLTRIVVGWLVAGRGA